MNKIIILNGNILTSTGFVEGVSLVIENGKIVCMDRRVPFRKSDLVIDAKGLLVLPGFIDQHIHGGGGADAMDGTIDAIETIVQTHARHGTTALCLATVASSEHDMFNALTNINKFINMQRKRLIGGAKVLGVNLEGPFLSIDKKGAHREDFIEAPSMKNLSKYRKILNAKLKLVTIAPEVPGALELISQLSKVKYPIVSVGHSNADIKTALQAFAKGAKCVTHFYNAMTPFHHRHPGIMGAVAQTNSVMIEIIPDKNLVDPASIKIAAQLAGSKRVILITDALMPAGTLIGRFEFSGRDLQVQNGSCYTADGTVWGSILTMDRALGNFRNIMKWPMEIAVNTASKNPASLLGIKAKGSLQIGYDGDVVIASEEVEILATVVEGNLIYNAM